MANETAVAKREPRVAARVGRVIGGIVPQTVGELWQFAQIMCKSGMVPKSFNGSTEAVFCAVQMGMECGMSPMQSVQNIYVVNGRPSIWGDAALALIRASGLLVDFEETPVIDEKSGEVIGYHCRAVRKGQKTPMTGRFFMLDARRAHLEHKQGPWTDYPQRMLQMRARSWCLRDGFADVLKGMRLAEEEKDIVDVEYQVVPPKAAAPAAVAGEDKLLALVEGEPDISHENSHENSHESGAPDAAGTASRTGEPDAAGADAQLEREAAGEPGSPSVESAQPSTGAHPAAGADAGPSAEETRESTFGHPPAPPMTEQPDPLAEVEQQKPAAPPPAATIGKVEADRIVALRKELNFRTKASWRDWLEKAGLVDPETMVQALDAIAAMREAIETRKIERPARIAEVERWLEMATNPEEKAFGAFCEQNSITKKPNPSKMPDQVLALVLDYVRANPLKG